MQYCVRLQITVFSGGVNETPPSLLLSPTEAVSSPRDATGTPAIEQFLWGKVRSAEPLGRDSAH